MGPIEIVLIILALVLVFGARKLPELGKGLGEGIREFRHGVNHDGKTNGLADHDTVSPEERA
ncbi:Sec-independent protein translocase subunit TatA/TatB [Deinococcus peraridilitoris]|uniref:Sec-independent protein translocase protein TatA n=1 Tax=Deinococcus peraridilitoris (strain DSM 19664 / LMG 22246 / CIP 109416 / KR-200) TaxID=937777 RepID=L0A319_DEIPD|nr:twin-arginine translocase TatA/TatE family subunit [Deinococcus peraridilitoris]AFZ67405.1 twin arginine-targeting protein translocase, TatA/E family [Deinococcus peraridilitoris DSM 19664]